MTPRSSGMTRASRNRMPASLSPRARKARLASCVRPDRISLPMIRTQAVTILDAALLVIALSTAWSSPSRCLHRQMHAAAQPHEDCRAAVKSLPWGYNDAYISRLAATCDDGLGALRSIRARDQDPRAGGLRGHAASGSARGRDARL